MIIILVVALSAIFYISFRSRIRELAALIKKIDSLNS
jgi:hypothetical protein